MLSKFHCRQAYRSEIDGPGVSSVLESIIDIGFK